MARTFNTTGPCRPEQHYMLPPAARLVGAHLDRYVREQLYWVLHAPRQTGKTTFLQAWMKELNASGAVVACYVSVERCQEVSSAEQAIPAINAAACEFAAAFGVPPPALPVTPAHSALSAQLTQWAGAVAPRPLVVLFDEVDVLQDQALVSFLRQLRSGFAARGVGRFPVSVALVGLRDLRDYLVQAKDGAAINPGSPFNIKHSSATLANFSEADIAALTAQHTADTGQAFTPAALARLWHYTSGQPWLVNALCSEVVTDAALAGAGVPVTGAHIAAATELLIASRAVHIDSLAQRLREPRVRRVVEPILIGASDPEMAAGDEFQFCLDLGLVALDETGTPSIANRLYREVLARTLAYGMQMALPLPEFRWQSAIGGLDVDALLREFQKFWRRHSAVWEQKADYTEAFPHLLLTAYLQRVVNGGGRVERECAAGRGRMDLLLEYAGRRHVIEIKLVREGDTREAVREEGLAQIRRYADTVAADTCHLVLFDRRAEWQAKPWDERLGWESDTSGRPVTIVWA